MKKKFVLTLALVLMVAVTLTAATPVEVSGTFDFGYKMTFKNPLTVTTSEGSKYNTFVSVSSDYWEVSLEGGTELFADGEKAPFTATADIFLDKALADEGVDMGDLGLTLHVGPGVGAAAQSVFADKADWKGFKAEGTAANFGTTIAYGDLVEVYVAADAAAKKDIVIGAKSAPVDGVSVALGYAVAPKTFAGSVAADVAKLADLDFDLAVTAAYFGDFTANNVWASVAGAYEGIGLWVQYGTNLTVHRLAAKASYSTTVEGVDLGAGVTVSSLDLAADPLKVDVEFDASAAYTMGGVKYKLALGYKLDGDFHLTPSVSFSF